MGCIGISARCTHCNTFFTSCHTDPTCLYCNWITGMTTYLKNTTTMLLGSIFAIIALKTTKFYMYINKVYYACRC